MFRRSTRLKAKEDASQTHAGYSGDKATENDKKPRQRGRKRSKPMDPESDEDKPVAETSGKKRKRMPEQFRKVKGRFGLLEKLAKDVPLDVIFEIFCYLEPGDLLRLARTSKDLRGILMSKSSENIWRTAREGVQGLPPLPSDLNEPQYANLLFESYCYVCKRRSDNVLWSFRMRMCRNCAATFLPLYYDEEFLLKQPSEYRELYILPMEFITDNYGHRVQVCSNKIAERFKTEFEALQTAEDRKEWITRKGRERRYIAEHGRKCEEWLRSKLRQRAHELQDVRTQRREAILVRLEELGLREEAELMGYQFREQKLVKQSRKLTEYGWNNIKDELVQMLSDHREERLAKERREILSKRYNRLLRQYEKVFLESDLRELFPVRSDILTHALFEDLIWDTPLEEDLTDEFFQSKLSEFLPGILDEWRPAKIQELVDVMRKAVPEATASDLKLANSLFKCSRCFDKMLFPQMFYHRCCCLRSASETQAASNGSDRDEERTNLYDSLFRFSEYPLRWRPHCLTWRDGGTRTANTILQAAALDPNTATIQDIDLADPLIECKACSAQQYGRRFMRWHAAVVHDHATYPPNIIANSFGEETEKIVAREPLSDTSTYYSRDTLCCNYCHKPLKPESFVAHLSNDHQDTIDIDEKASTRSKIKEHSYLNPLVTMKYASVPFWYRG